MNTDIVILSAMKEEMQEYKGLFSNTSVLAHSFLPIFTAKFNNKNIAVVVSGIGKANSSATTAFAIEKLNPKLIVNVGTCGGLHNCNIADVIVSSKCGYIDVNLEIFGYKKGQMANEEEYFNSYKNINLLLNSLTKKLNFIKTGTICTADSFISNQEKLKSAISCYSNPICVEMEATAIAQICNHYKIPALFIKKVSDLADSNAKDSFNKNVSKINENLVKTLKLVLSTV